MHFHKFHHYPSTYLVFIVWALFGFMAQPTVASLMVHVCGLGLLYVTVWLAHYEGRESARYDVPSGGRSSSN